ncbi:MAG: hypothetical protein AAGB93_25065, partial [Planctomycetota bacterium]
EIIFSAMLFFCLYFQVGDMALVILGSNAGQLFFYDCITVALLILNKRVGITCLFECKQLFFAPLTFTCFAAFFWCGFDLMMDKPG